MSAPPDRIDATPPRRPRRSIARFVWAGLFTAAAAIGLLPDLLFGLDHRSPWVQLVSFRWQLLVAGAVLLVVLGLVTLRVRAAWPFTVGLLVVLLIGAGMVAPRAIADPAPTGGTLFTVLSFNTYEGSADVNALTDLIRAARPDVVGLPEAGQQFESRLAPLIEPLGYRLRSSTGEGTPDVQGVTAAVAARLGDVSFKVGHNTSSFPDIEMSGGALGAMRVIAFHSVAPVPGSVGDWRDDMALLPNWCAGPTPAIVAGDFNATLDHSLMRAGMVGCGDAASQRGDGLVPTWGPTDRTRAIGPQIDHVLATKGIEASSFRVVDLPGSDHHALLTTLRLP
ncbi:MAG: endonuclease/exonuclease/phosphatase family protein [Pseudonocardiales bacterium]|nr:endonuclease/exonuclease/phosphatase family protein [Pseudonocardiales bacterium]